MTTLAPFRAILKTTFYINQLCFAVLMYHTIIHPVILKQNEIRFGNLISSQGLFRKYVGDKSLLEKMRGFFISVKIAMVFV